MIGFKQYLAEVFDTVLPFTYDTMGEGRKSSVYFFSKDGIKYKSIIERGKKFDEISFYVYIPSQGYVLKPSNLGSPFDVYGTLVATVRDHYKRVSPSGRTIVLDPVLDKMAPIYRRFAKVLAKELRGVVEERSSGQIRVVVPK